MADLKKISSVIVFLAITAFKHILADMGFVHFAKSRIRRKKQLRCKLLRRRRVNIILASLKYILMMMMMMMMMMMTMIRIIKMMIKMNKHKKIKMKI